MSIAYAQVRRLILAGELEPGSRVTVRPLADRLGMSQAPIRTALAALERQGLLQIHEHRGYFVPQVGRTDMLEVYELRESVDSIASRRVARSADRDEVVEALTELLARQRECVRVGDLESYGELDVAFHELIWDRSGNRRLVAIAENLLGQVRVGNNISARAPGRLPVALQEHVAIVEALRTGDPDRAEQATREHVRNSSVAFAQLLGEE